MAKLTIETIEKVAISAHSSIGNCGATDHTDCHFTTYTTAEVTNGGKAHKYYYSVHTSDGVIRGQGVPYCGSRNRSWTGHGLFVEKVTCGRCW